MKQVWIFLLVLLWSPQYLLIASDGPLWVRGNDGQVVAFPQYLLQDSDFFSTAVARAQHLSENASSIGSINTVSSFFSAKSEKKGHQNKKELYGDLSINAEGMLLDKTLLSSYCSNADLRYYRRLLTMALGGLENVAVQELSNQVSSKAFLIAWMADYLASNKMKQICTQMLPKQLIKAFCYKGVSSILPDNVFLNRVFQWADTGTLQNETNDLVRESFLLQKLPFASIGKSSLVKWDRHSFILQEEQALYLCTQQKAQLWQKNKIFEARADQVIRHALKICNRCLGLVTYSKQDNLSRLYFLFGVADEQKPLREKKAFVVSGTIDHILCLSHNTFVWSSGNTAQSALWDKKKKSWKRASLSELENCVENLVELGKDHFAIFSRREVKIFVYNALLKEWKCRYNRIFDSGQVYGVLALLQKYAVISINRLLFFIPCTTFGDLWEKACLGLPYLGAITPKAIGDDTLILQGSQETASLLVDKNLHTFFRILCKQSDFKHPSGFFLVPASREQLFCIHSHDVWCLEPLRGTKNSCFCGKAYAPLVTGCRLSSKQIVFADSVGNLYVLSPRVIADKRVLLAAACMKTFYEKTGKPLPVVSNGWIDKTIEKSKDRDWLWDVMEHGYGVEPSKKSCTVM